MGTFLYRLFNWLVGLCLFALLCMGLMLMFCYTFPGMDGLLDGGARRVVKVWAVLNLLAPFDAIGFLKKMATALRSSFEWGMLFSSAPKGADATPRPWHRYPYRQGSILSKIHHLGAFGFCCLVPVWIVHLIYPGLGVMDAPWGLVILLAWVVLSQFVGHDPFNSVDRWIAETEAKRARDGAANDATA